MHSKMNPARVDREDERRMLPCRNFLDGFCPKGNRCRFYHPLPSAIPTVIRVPSLPASFQQNTSGNFSMSSGRPAMFSMSPAQSARGQMGINQKLGIGTSSRLLGMNGMSNSFSRGLGVPVSPSYSEYEMAYAQQMEVQKEKERRAAAPPALETEENNGQNTVFSHIDWKEFLAPGVRPPPPTHVPYMSNSPGKPTDDLDSFDCLIRATGASSIASPITLCKTSFLADSLNSEIVRQTVSKEKTPSPRYELAAPTIRGKPMSAKEELQMKVKQIAKDLAAEPAQHVHSLDTFFRNYTFQSIPTAPSSEQDLVGHNAIDVDQMEPNCLILGGDSGDLDLELPCSESDTVSINASNAFASSDSGISSEFSSGDSASSMDSVKPEHEDHDFEVNKDSE